MRKPTATLDTVLLPKSSPIDSNGDPLAAGVSQSMNHDFTPPTDWQRAAGTDPARPPAYQPGHPPGHPPGRKSGSIKFAYASGSRPLDGYTIKRGIGAGGFGEVYFAVSDGGKEVALKRIQRNLDVELRGVTQCLNLKHHNLVALFDIRHDDHGQAWVVMEYVAGESLKDAIDRHPGGMPQELALFWLRGIIAGVDYLHDHGIVHRDLKPGNIFLDDEVIKIGDYGLSKFISCSRRGGQTESVGTFHYMAPEIGKGVYGREIDLYALGVMLYEMITGRVPFDGESGQEIIMKHLTDSPRLTDLPVAYRAAVAKALAKDPANRFSSAGQMLAAVEAALRGDAGSHDMQQGTSQQGAERDVLFPQLAAGFANPAPAENRQGKDVLYIGDEEEEIKLGEVKEIVTAEPVPTRQPAPQPVGQPAKPPVRTESQRPGNAPPNRAAGPQQGNPPYTDRRDQLGGPNRHYSVAAQPQPIRPANTHRAAEPQRDAPRRGGAAFASGAASGEVLTIADREPIARAMGESCTRLGQAWSAAKINTPVKIVLLLAAVIVVVLNSQWLVPLALVLGVVYLIYYGVRSIVLSFRDSEERPSGAARSATQTRYARSAPQAPYARSAPEAPYARHVAQRRLLTRRGQLELLRTTLARKSFNERATEAVGAMLLSALIAAALSLAFTLIGGQSLVDSVFGWSSFAWMTIVATIASWVVLIVAKSWEGIEGNHWRRRFTMLLAGLAVGAAAWGAANVLLVDFGAGTGARWDTGPSLAAEVLSIDNLHDAQGLPTLPAYLAYFAGLFAIVRWWRLADPLRSARLSLVASGACVFWAWILGLVWKFPEPWGLMLAAVIAVSIQISSLWLSPKAKAKVQAEAQEA